MNGRLESLHFPYLPLRREVRGQTYGIEALIDTGFDGFLAVPKGLLTDRDPADYQRWTLADGSGVYAPYFVGVVHVGSAGRVEGLITVLGDEPLVGRRVTDHFRLVLDHSERVIVEA